MTLRYSIAVVASLTLAAVVLIAFDGSGLFIYFFYLPLACIGAAWILCFSTFRRRTRSRLDAIVMISGLTSFTALGLALPHLPTSARKSFFIRATAISPGMPVTALRRSLADCRAQENPDSISFFYWDGPGTQDVVVVKVTADRKTVVSAEYSPD